MKYSFLLYIFIITSCANTTSTDTNMTITSTHSQPAQFTIVTKKGTTVIDLVSQFGIGTALLSLSKGKWPEKIVLHLHLQGLEGFNVSNGKIKLEKENLTITRSDNKRYYIVQLPTELFTYDVNEVSIQWLDFYR